MTSALSDLPTLILASGSPRRRELLTGLGLRFTVRAVDLDETPGDGEPPEETVLRLAREKAAARAHPGELVLAADTVVVIDGQLLGKPRDPADARRMLATIAGREHTVLTGVALEDPGRNRRISALERSRVRMAALTPEEIAWYVATGEPLDKAGSYAVQGIGALFVEEVHGNYTNVVGLPLPLTYRLFRAMGWELLGFR
ncbi:MAG: nucleoside triphosphate pyrophosphatase [Acidobacteriota bacterium]|nr:nucleoside triphosphate pyrophosphatase [Acidobacteriota bacterium]